MNCCNYVIEEPSILKETWNDNDEMLESKKRVNLDSLPCNLYNFGDSDRNVSVISSLTIGFPSISNNINAKFLYSIDPEELHEKCQSPEKFHPLRDYASYSTACSIESESSEHSAINSPSQSHTIEPESIIPIKSADVCDLNLLSNCTSPSRDCTFEEEKQPEHSNFDETEISILVSKEEILESEPSPQLEEKRRMVEDLKASKGEGEAKANVSKNAPGLVRDRGMRGVHEITGRSDQKGYTSLTLEVLEQKYQALNAKDQERLKYIIIVLRKRTSKELNEFLEFIRSFDLHYQKEPKDKKTRKLLDMLDKHSQSIKNWKDKKTWKQLDLLFREKGAETFKLIMDKLMDAEGEIEMLSWLINFGGKTEVWNYFQNGSFKKKYIERYL